MSQVDSFSADVTEELERELHAQADELSRRLSRSQERVRRVEAYLDVLRAQVRSDVGALAELEGLLGRGAQRPLECDDPQLRGARLREVAVRILAERAPQEAVHYRDWFSWVRDAGYEVAGRDPLASFLAQITRHQQVERVGGSRSGRYMLRST